MKRIIKPIEQIPVHEKIQTQERDQVGERQGPGVAFLHPQQHEYCDQCCPNLRLERILARTDEGLDPQILFERFEEDLDLPAILRDFELRAQYPNTFRYSQDKSLSTGDLSRFSIKTPLPASTDCCRNDLSATRDAYAP
jgi:hypothetical protein